MRWTGCLFNSGFIQLLIGNVTTVSWKIIVSTHLLEEQAIFKGPILQIVSVLLSLVMISCGGDSSNDDVSLDTTDPTVVPIDTSTNEATDELAATPASTPFSGSIFVDANIITSDDASSLVSITANGTGERVMFDRRPDSFVTLTPYLFNAQYDDGLSIEIQINPEFDVNMAGDIAETYARYLGQLPTLLRRDVETP